MTQKQFHLCRIFLGLFLLYYFGSFIPYASELFTGEGLGNSLLSKDFFITDVVVTQSVLTLGVAASFLILFDRYRRPACLCVLIFFVFLRHQNSIIPYSPEQGFMGWAVMLAAYFPSHSKEWEERPLFWHCAWLFAVINYSLFGLQKISQPYGNHIWTDGTAIGAIFNFSVFRRDWYGDFFTFVPQQLLRPLTWTALVVELGAPIFYLWRRTRELWWILALFLHLGILFFLALAPVSFGMIIFHFFLFDSRWLKARGSIFSHAPQWFNTYMLSKRGERSD